MQLQNMNKPKERKFFNQAASCKLHKRTVSLLTALYKAETFVVARSREEFNFYHETDDEINDNNALYVAG